MKLVLGVDCGIHGGLTMITTDAVPEIIETIDIPIVGEGAKQRVDAIALHSFVAKWRPQHAYIERAQAMPKQGASSGFKYGRAVGAIEAILACSMVPVTIVEPRAWKHHFHLKAKDKEGGRQRALELFPAAHASLARKKDHGRAEAALIAMYGVAR